MYRDGNAVIGGNMRSKPNKARRPVVLAAAILIVAALCIFAPALVVAHLL
jgi:hypothetical protein